MVTIDNVMESHALPTGTSMLKAEVIALTRALELSQGRWVDMYTDSMFL